MWRILKNIFTNGIIRLYEVIFFLISCKILEQKDSILIYTFYFNRHHTEDSKLQKPYKKMLL